ncbi:MAG: hypothetical protein QOI06_2879 [Nocardioidaceae bacterium]|jgi:hypothetical protein|nr:hypothetical protein [Nocardioidaceae bacterium]
MQESEKLWTSDRLRADHCLSAAAGELLDDVLALKNDRGGVHRLLDQIVENPASDEDLLRAEQWTRLWYGERYRRAQAFQHRADYRGSDSGLFEDEGRYRSVLARVGASGPELKQIEMQLPPGFMDFLGTVKTHSWQHILGLHQANLRSWWDEGDVDGIRRVFDYPSEEADRVNGRTEPAHSILKSFGTNLLKDMVGPTAQV